MENSDLQMESGHRARARNRSQKGETLKEAPQRTEAVSDSGADASVRQWRYADFARLPYSEAQALQVRLVEARKSGRLPHDTVLLLEHPAVFTVGRRGGIENLTVSSEFLAERAVAVVQTERGGNITYHGPGQLVAYPIVALSKARIRVVDFVTGLEEVMIRTAAEWGIEAGRDDRNRGVWAGDRKLGSIGIAVRRGISFHGMALNVNLSLDPFGWINPCGLSGVSMISMARLVNRAVSMQAVKDAVVRHFGSVFEVNLTKIPAEEIVAGTLTRRNT